MLRGGRVGKLKVNLLHKSFDKLLRTVVIVSPMSKQLNWARKIRALKTGSGFTVKNERQRQQVCRTAKALKDGGVIDFLVITKIDDDGTFRVGAI